MIEPLLIAKNDEHELHLLPQNSGGRSYAACWARCWAENSDNAGKPASRKA
jgi:hypothetical protein